MITTEAVLLSCFLTTVSCHPLVRMRGPILGEACTIVLVLIPMLSIKATAVINSEFSFNERNFLYLVVSVSFLGALNVAEVCILYHKANKYLFFALMFVGVFFMHILEFWHNKAIVILYFGVLLLIGFLYVPCIFDTLLVHGGKQIPVIVMGFCVRKCGFNDRDVFVGIIGWVVYCVYKDDTAHLASTILLEFVVSAKWLLRLYNKIENAVTSSVLNVIGEQCRALLILLFGLLGLVLCFEPPYGDVIMLVALGSSAFAIVRTMTKASRERI